MTSFDELIEKTKMDHLPSVAMEYDGYFLENEVPGYKTIRVKGREMLSVEIETENPSGRNGSFITGQTLPAREIEVTYMLRADTNEGFQHVYSLLMKKLLKENDVPIRFADQPKIYVYGRYSTTSDVPDDRNWVVASYTIYCQDPYKYTNAVTTQSQNAATIGYITRYPMKPDEIKIVLGSNASKITIDNETTGKHIILNGTYLAGQEIKINIVKNSITRNGQNIMNNLDYMETDFHNFTLKNRDRIRVSPNSVLFITTRGRSL